MSNTFYSCKTFIRQEDKLLRQRSVIEHALNELVLELTVNQAALIETERKSLRLLSGELRRARNKHKEKT